MIYSYNKTNYSLISQIYFWNRTLHVSGSLCVHHQKSSTETSDDGQRNCPKHVEFYSKNKFKKLVHLVGFIIRIYHDARSPERQKKTCRWWVRVVDFD